MPFKPPALDVGLSLAQSTNFDAQKSLPAFQESLQISGGVVSRVKPDEQYSVEISEKDLNFLSLLGSGASSKVYKALLCKQGQAVPPKFVAVKKISNLDEALQKQMKKDVKVLMDANHAQDGPAAADTAGLVKFEGAYLNSQDQEVAIVLEYMDAGSLEDVQKRVKRIPEAQLANIMHMALKGLYFLHKHLHIVHRDIKPANILISSDGSAKIADFGIARSLDSTQAMCNTFMGSFAYMAPERFNGQKYGFSSDIWSLGLCVVECATGKSPYAEHGTAPVPLMLAIMNNPVPLPPEDSFSEEIRDFCSQCLQKEPAKRATALQLLSHPWILKHSNSPVDMAAFIGGTVDPHKTFDDIAYFFTYQYYHVLSVLLTGEPREAAMAVECLKGLYTEGSVYSMVVDSSSQSSSLPKRPRGKTGIAAKILDTMRMFRAWGVQRFEMRNVDCSVVPGGQGSVIIMVRGELAGGHSGGSFADMFLLGSSVSRDGERCFTISNQSFTLM